MSDSKLLLTVQETADRLGMSRAYVYRLMERGELPFVLLGRARRVRVSALEEFVRSLADSTSAEVRY